MFSFALLGLLFNSCEKEDSAADELAFSLKKAKTEDSVQSQSVGSSFLYAKEACVGVPHKFVINAEPGKNEQIQMETTDGDWVQIGQISKTTEASMTYEYTFDSPGYYQLRYKAGGHGFTKGYFISVSECLGCVESFSYTVNDDLNVVFSYTSAVDVLGAVVKLTCPHIQTTDGFTSDDGKVYEVNNTGNNTVLSWTGDLAACQKITFYLTLIPDCSKKNNGNGEVTLWTDFKVNEESKKTVTPPENADCKTILVDEQEMTICSWPIIKYSGCE